MPDPAENNGRPHTDRDALDGVDDLKHHGWYVSGPVCGMGTGRTDSYDSRLCARAYRQILGEAGHVFSQDN